jgi:hypothetical protein
MLLLCKTIKIFEFFLKYMGKMAGAGARAGVRAGATQKWTNSATLL